MLKALLEKNLCTQGTKIEQGRVGEIWCLQREANNGSQETLLDLLSGLCKHGQCFLVTIHVPSPLSFLLAIDVTMTSCENTILIKLQTYADCPYDSYIPDNLEMACRPFSYIRSSLLRIAGRTKSATLI